MKKILADLPYYVARFRKGLVGFVGVASSLLSANLLPAEYAGYISVALGIATVLLNVLVANAPKREAEPVTEELPAVPVEPPHEGEVLDPFPATVEIPAQSDTAGIPLIEHDTLPVETNYGGMSVDEILARLKTEGYVSDSKEKLDDQVMAW